MNVFEKVTESPEALASLLRAIPAIETTWDDAFHRLYCSSCSAADCDDCRRPERDSPLLVAPFPECEQLQQFRECEHRRDSQQQQRELFPRLRARLLRIIRKSRLAPSMGA